MKFKSFLMENDYSLKDKYDDVLINKFIDSIRPAIKFIHSNCKPFLSMIKDDDFALFRGIRFSDIKNNDYWNIYSVRKDRKPLGSTKINHEIMNLQFEKIHGISDWRSISVFAIKNPNVSASYGVPSMIFPIGNFHIAWNNNVSDSYQNARNYVEFPYNNVYSIIEKYVVDESIQNKIAISIFDAWNKGIIPLLNQPKLISDDDVIDKFEYFLSNELRWIPSILVDFDITTLIQDLIIKIRLGLKHRDSWIQEMNIDQYDQYKNISTFTEITLWGFDRYVAIHLSTENKILNELRYRMGISVYDKIFKKIINKI